MHKKNNHAGFIPRFDKAFLHPRYWGIWFGVGLLVLLSYLPIKWRDGLMAFIGFLVGKCAKGARRRARINLIYCMSNLTKVQREKIIDEMFCNSTQPIMLILDLCLRGPQFLASRVHWHDRFILNEIEKKKTNIILLLPHAWSIDIPGMLLTSEGKPITAMFHQQRNPLFDYLWNSARMRFGAYMHARKDTIKPFIHAIQQGFWGHYAPDEDYGPEKSIFVDFFDTYKATLPTLGRLMKICNAVVIPIFPVYNYRTHRMDIFIRPPMNQLLAAEDADVARHINKELEIFLSRYPSQYIWSLKLLKTRRKGEIEPYLREDI